MNLKMSVSEFAAKALTVTLACLFLFTGAAQAEVKPLPIDFSGGLPAQEDGFKSDMEYEDESIHVRIETGRAFNTNYFVAYIKIADPTQIRSAAAGGFESDKVMPGEVLAKRVNAVLAVNGDYFNYTGDGYLVRQGEKYRDVPNRYRDTLMIDENGDFHIVMPATEEKLAPFRDMKIINSFNFGPALVIDGVKRTTIPSNNQVKANDPKQRMCVAQTGKLEYFCIASEGPEEKGSRGMTLKELASVAFDLGAVNAYNLDGGYSTMLLFGGKKVNAPNNKNVRDISDILYFASADTKAGE
jgi:exopolysaccharide biosynthesis protein